MAEFKVLPDSEITEILNRAFTITDNPFMDDGTGCVLPHQYRKLAEKIEKLKVRSDDVFLCSVPRTGSTWLSEILWLLGNDLDFDKARSIVQQIRTPTLELSALMSDDKDLAEWLNEHMKGNSVDFIEQMEVRRFIKTHLPWHLLPEQLRNNPDIKIVYTMRNPKDQIVSFYHYCLLAHRMNCSFEDFVKVVLSNKMVYGSTAEHMLEFYKRRHSNVLVIRYEDMKRDLPTVIRQCAEHLDIKRKLTSEDIDNICDYVRFDKMQNNNAVNLETLVFKDPAVKEQIDQEAYNKVKFIRKGQVGDWQNYLSPELNAQVDKWISENLDGTGLTFEYV